VDNILTNTLLPEVSRILLGALAEGRKPSTIRVGIGPNGAFTYQPEDEQASRKGRPGGKRPPVSA
jgi:type VI secretion system protein VasG